MSSLQPAQLSETPVAESIQEGRMAICQRWEQDSCTGGWGEGQAIAASGTWTRSCDLELLGFHSICQPEILCRIKIGELL